MCACVVCACVVCACVVLCVCVCARVRVRACVPHSLHVQRHRKDLSGSNQSAVHHCTWWTCISIKTSTGKEEELMKQLKHIQHTRLHNTTVDKHSITWHSGKQVRKTTTPPLM